jgi:hypothetical protein
MAEKEHKVKSPKKSKINYGCNGGFCAADPKKAHIGSHGSQVELHATNTDVTITFDKKKSSPFTPDAPSISLTQGTSQTFTVSTTASGGYPYVIACSTCPTPSNSPDMIVP